MRYNFLNCVTVKASTALIDSFMCSCSIISDWMHVAALLTSLTFVGEMRLAKSLHS